MNRFPRKAVALFALTLLCFVTWAGVCGFGRSEPEKCVDRFFQAYQKGERANLLAEIDPDSFLYMMMSFSMGLFSPEGIAVDYTTDLVEQNDERAVVRVTGRLTMDNEPQEIDMRFILRHDEAEGRWLIENIEGWDL